ncbi:atypical chemokine receptor 2-like [Arapaima gigas]
MVVSSLSAGTFTMAMLKMTENTTKYLEHNHDYNSYYSEDYFDKYAPCDKSHVTAFMRIFLPVFYAVLTVLSITGNLLLAVVLIRWTKLRSTTSVFLLNMAVSDCLFAATLPFWAVSACSQWLFGSVGCKALTAVYTLNLYSSIFFITCVSLEAYLCVVWARDERWVLARKRTICIAVWLLASLTTVPSLIFITLEEEDGEKHCVYVFGDDDMTPWKLFLKFQLNIFGFLLPFLSMTFFFLRILCVMLKSNITKGFKILKLALLLLGVFFVLWFPYNLVVFLHSLQDLHVITDCTVSANLDFAVQVTQSLAFVHACLNLVIYASVHRRFRNELRRMLKRMCQLGREYSLECTGSTSLVAPPSPPVILTTVC